MYVTKEVSKDPPTRVGGGEGREGGGAISLRPISDCGVRYTAAPASRPDVSLTGTCIRSPGFVDAWVPSIAGISHGLVCSLGVKSECDASTALY